MIAYPSSPSFFHNPDTPRKIHIWEFPEEFWVQLDEGTTRELVDRASENVGGIEPLASVLNVHIATVYRYRTCRTFIPLPLLQKLCELVGEGFTMEQVEPHVMAYKGGRNTHPIRNPHLPLMETPDLFALMAHIMGDGGYNATYESSYYVNTHTALIRKFLRLLHATFGAVPVHFSVRKRPSCKDGTYVLFGPTVVRFFGYLYQTDFQASTARVPQRLFDLPREYAAAYLRAFGDDEGNIDDGQIIICSANQELLQGIYALIQAKFPELAEFVVFEEEGWKSKTLFHIRFRTGAFISYRALIGFTHPEKQQTLDRILARKQRGWVQRSDGTTRRMLLQRIMSRPMTTKELAKFLEVTVHAIRYHVKGLLALGAIQVSGTGSEARRPVMFEITERGRKFLLLPSLGLLSRRAGRRKVELLKTLVKGNLGVEELRQKLGWAERIIYHHVNGRDNHGKWQPGLVEMGLVSRSGRGCMGDPSVYRLTTEGQRVVDALETIFPSH